MGGGLDLSRSFLDRESRQFEKRHLDVSRHLDLDCSQLSRPLRPTFNKLPLEDR
jgi:hypothetical protein